MDPRNPSNSTQGFLPKAEYEEICCKARKDRAQRTRTSNVVGEELKTKRNAGNKKDTTRQSSAYSNIKRGGRGAQNEKKGSKQKDTTRQSSPYSNIKRGGRGAQNEKKRSQQKDTTRRSSALEFITGRTGHQKTLAPGPFPSPAPLNGLGRGVFFGIPCPCPRSSPRPTHTPDGSPLKMGGKKRGPV